jgi:hypothetical protein
MLSRRCRLSWYMLSLAMVLSACSAVLDPVVPTPRPSIAPSLEPSIPSTAVSLSATALPTQAAIIPATATDGPSPTPLFGPAPTRPRYTPTPTQQAIVPGTLRIEYFTTDATVVKPGDTLTLYWLIKGIDSAVIYRLDADGKRGESWNLSRNRGSLQVRVRPDERDTARFVLVVGDTANEIDQTLSIPLSCVDGWFFDPQPVGCPASPAVATRMVQQPFEHGLMFWVQTEKRIYVLFDDKRSPAWAYYEDQFKDGQPESDPAFQPPSAGLVQPIRGFGLVWRSHQKEVRARLGWATAPEDAYDGQLQGDGTVKAGVMYLRDKDGNILQLTDAGSDWRPLKAGG